MLRSLYCAAVAIGVFSFGLRTTTGEMVPYTKRWDIKFTSLRPAEVLTKLDLGAPGLEEAKGAADRGDREAALLALRNYYRKKFPFQDQSLKDAEPHIMTADRLTRHVFQWGPYEPADYGKDIKWEIDPRDDIEWVAAIYRFYWAESLARAYAATRNDKYAETFVELTSDWIRKHPLEDWTRTHPTLKHWRGFAWLDLQTGIRATRICDAFKTLVHSDAFTPEFLGVMLAGLYDHQVKTSTIPMGIVHNKAIFEQRGFVSVAATLSEFKESRSWMALGLERARENLLAQVTEDGVQREWCGSYHMGVLRDVAEMMAQAESAGVPVPEDYRRRVVAMYDYVYAIATPDLGFPMFGDTARPLVDGKKRSEWPLYSALLRGTTLLKDPKYAALARGDEQGLPGRSSAAFAQAGSYVLRSGPGLEQIYFALHCPPPGISSHDQPDNGTFELWAYGRWLMTDTGFYTYGHEKEKRAWHRRTRVHQTLTLDGEDSRIAGKLRLWRTSPTCDAVVVENQAYPGLMHRRNIWFVDRRLLVVLDEAIGDALGVIGFHYQLAAGDAVVDREHKLARTNFDDANVLVWADPRAPVVLEPEEGWTAWEYGHRKPRPAFCYRHQSKAPVQFLSLIVPYRGMQPPQVSARLAPSVAPDETRVEVLVEAFGRHWRVGRDLATQEAWCREGSH